MINEAEQNAEADKERREMVETKNQAEQVIHSTEKMLVDFGEKIEAAEKSDIEKLIDEAKEALSADDASQMIAVALTLPSLTPEQMSQLKQYSEQYRFDYWNLCEDMIRLYESNAEAQTQSNAWMNQQDMQREIEKETLRFQRKELYDRAQLMLRMILSDDQIKDIPGLRPSADNPAKWGKGNDGKGNEGK